MECFNLYTHKRLFMLSTDKTGQFPVSLLLSHEQINTSGYPSLRAERKLLVFCCHLYVELNKY